MRENGFRRTHVSPRPVPLAKENTVLHPLSVVFKRKEAEGRDRDFIKHGLVRNSADRQSALFKIGTPMMKRSANG